jgi:hypothetical protein
MLSDAPTYWGTSRTARALELSEFRVRQLADRGKLRAIRTADGKRLFDPGDVQRFIAERRGSALEHAP